MILRNISMLLPGSVILYSNGRGLHINHHENFIYHYFEFPYKVVSGRM